MRASLLVISLSLASILALGACQTMGTSSATTPATISVEASTTAIVAGETVTFIARSRDTFGREASINWTSTAGKLTTDQNGRVARVRFDEPGTYTVKATLSLDGRQTESSMVEIRVRPLQ